MPFQGCDSMLKKLLITCLKLQAAIRYDGTLWIGSSIVGLHEIGALLFVVDCRTIAVVLGGHCGRK